jgi:hypothetical protein
MKGSITVEAAVMLPFFIITIMAFVFIMKVYYTYEIMQNALTGACKEMSVYGLLYYKTNAEELISAIEKAGRSDTVSDTLGNNWLTSSIQKAGKDATDYTRTQLALIPAAKLLVNKNLEESFGLEVDEGLRRLNITNGFQGMAFSESKMLADGKSIDISVCYEIRFPFLSNILPGVKVRQSASSCIWAGENGVAAEAGEDEKEAGIWDMTNMKRGQEIRKLQGANLPFNFPTVAKFENGTVTSIKSLNIDEVYYQNSVNLKQKIIGYINKLEEFNGDTCGTVSISRSEIYKKELLLIIPETELNMSQQSVINECILLAGRKGISLNIVKAYGKQGAGVTTPGADEDTKEGSGRK